MHRAACLTQLFFLLFFGGGGAERLEQFQNVTQIQVKDFMFYVPMHRLVGLVGEKNCSTDAVFFFQNRPLTFSFLHRPI